LQVLSKIMNSPLDALTVFTQFMSSPIDSLQIISKVMSSPNDVLEFMKHLMVQPESAIDIMHKFMSSPAEALQIINRMINHQNPDMYDETKTKKPAVVTAAEREGDSMIKSILCPNGRPETGGGMAAGGQAFDTTRDVIEDIAQKAMEPGSFESLIYQAIKIEFDSFGSNAAFAQPSTSTAGGSGPPSTGRDLNDGERAKLNELIVANKALYAPVDEDLSSLLSDDCGLRPDSNEANTPLLRVINLTAIAIRRLIKMSKKINSFKNMCQEDQIALLKGGCIEMMILRSVMQYDFDRATWKIPHSQEEMSNIKADVLKLAKGNIYEEHERFILTFEKSWRTDENIILILSAIVLFTPDRPKTVHSDVIKLEQNSYYYLLRRYLESSQPSGCEAKSTFLKLIKKINELHKLNTEMIRWVYKWIATSRKFL
jgi:nuclear receptor subfamily 1 group I